MSYYQLQISARDRQAFIKKYVKSGNINNALVLSNLHRLHLAFGGKESSDNSSLAGTKDFGFIRRNTIQTNHVTRISEDNAILESKESFPDGIEKQSTDMTQAFSLYVALNTRDSYGLLGQNDALARIEPNSETARRLFLQFLKSLTQNGQNFQPPEAFTQTIKDTSLNVDEQGFYELWTSLLNYKFIIDGKELDGVQQFYDFLIRNERLDGDIFGEAFTIDDSFFGISSSRQSELKTRAKRNQDAVRRSAKKAEKAAFNEQFYLMSRIEELAKVNSSKNYRNFSYIRDFDPSSNLENSIYFYSGQDLVLDMTPIQLSALVPYFKLYLVYQNGEEMESVLMPFQGTHLSLQELLDFKSSERSLGLKSFSWSYEGSTLVTADKLIDCSLKLFGSNLQALDSKVGQIQSAEKDIRFEDLLARTSNITFRAICGWAVPHSTDEKIINKELRRAINKSLITLELGPPIYHDFQFQQDGRFDLEIKYTGRLVKEFSDINLLIDQQTSKEVALQAFDLEILRKFKKVSAAQIQIDPTRKLVNPQSQMKDFLGGFIEQHFKNSSVSNAEIRRRLLDLLQGEKDLTKALNLANRLLLNKVRTVRTNEAFSNLLSKIELQDRIFYFNLDKNQLDSYLKGIVGRKRRLQQGSATDKALLRKKEERDKRLAKEKEEVGEEEFNKKQAANDAHFDATIALAKKEIARKDLTEEQKKPFRILLADSIARKVGGLTQEEAKQAREEEKKKEKETVAKREATKDVKKSPPRQLKSNIPDLFNNKTLNEKINNLVNEEKEPADKNFNLAFFFFGDLVESILSIAGKDNLDRKKLRILLGGLIYRDPSNNSKKNVTLTYIPLVDVPISIRNFSAFVHKNYIQKPVLDMDLNTFLTDAFNSLVQPIFSGRDAIFDLPDFAKRNTSVTRNFFTTDKKISHGLVHPRLLKSAAIKNSQENFSETTNFAFFNGNENNYSQSELDRGEDSRRGIMHLTLGGNRGLVKKATFSKQELRFVRTARLIQDPHGDKSMLDKLREPYDVFLEMYGNNILIKGCRFFITPTMPGFSLKNESARKQSEKSVASRLGLGGYYNVLKTENVISSEGFFTNIHGVNQTYADAVEEAIAITPSVDKHAGVEKLKSKQIKGKGVNR